MKRIIFFVLVSLILNTTSFGMQGGDLYQENAPIIYYSGRWECSNKPVILAAKPPSKAKKGSYTGSASMITDKKGHLIGIKHLDPKGYKWVVSSEK